MSVYIVDNAHIDFLVYSAQRYAAAQQSKAFYWYHNGEQQKLNDLNTKEISQMLLDENVASWNGRYDDDEQYDFEYNRTFAYGWPKPVQVLKSIKCYEYQASESPNWEESSAKAFMESLRHSAIAQLEGYEDAAWGGAAKVTALIPRVKKEAPKKEKPAKVIKKALAVDGLLWDF